MDEMDNEVDESNNESDEMDASSASSDAFDISKCYFLCFFIQNYSFFTFCFI